MSIAQYEEDKAQYVEQLEIVLLSLKEDPGNAELLGLKEELDSAISMIDESIAELRPKKTPAPPSKSAPKPASNSPPPPPPPEQPEKWSRENHPAFKKSANGGSATPNAAAAEEPEPAAVSYQVNDNVLAKWVSGDKGFYPARITSVTGSSTARMYTVKFKSYDEVETLRAKDIRPVAQKRKADGTPVTAGAAAASDDQQQQRQPSPQTGSGGTTPAAAAAAAPGSHSVVSNNGAVLSASPSLYPTPRVGGGQGSAELGPDGKPVKKFKKIKANKELEAGKNKWQDFNNKSKFGKSHGKKDSMFRTPEGVHGRVGFTGSGQAMRKDPSRSRHIYQQQDELD